MKGTRIRYSAEEMAWLEANRTMVISDYHRAFVERFGRTEVAAAHLHGLRKRKRWKVGRAPGRLAGRRRRYSEPEIAWLRENCTMVLAEYHRTFCARFGRDDVSAAQLLSLRKREGWKTGRDGRFEKGRESPSKGRKCEPGKSGRHPNARRTQFKKGQRPHTWRGAGHESTDANGYVWIVVDETNPYTGAPTRRVQKHRLLWEQAHGPVPDGHVLKCIDGDKSNTDPSNWEPVPLGLLPRLNGKSGRGYDHAPDELKPTIMAIAKLEHRAREAGKNGGRAEDGD